MIKANLLNLKNNNVFIQDLTKTNSIVELNKESAAKKGIYRLDRDVKFFLIRKRLPLNILNDVDFRSVFLSRNNSILQSLSNSQKEIVKLIVVQLGSFVRAGVMRVGLYAMTIILSYLSEEEALRIHSDINLSAYVLNFIEQIEYRANKLGLPFGNVAFNMLNRCCITPFSKGIPINEFQNYLANCSANRREYRCINVLSLLTKYLKVQKIELVCFFRQKIFPVDDSQKDFELKVETPTVTVISYRKRTQFGFISLSSYDYHRRNINDRQGWEQIITHFYRDDVHNDYQF
jgi:hypothetical protein